MKILFITGHKYLPQMYGGLQTCTDESCKSLMARGHQVAVMAGLLPGGWFALKARVKMKINKLLHKHAVARDTHLGYPVWRSWLPWNDVEYVARQEKPDLIVVMAVEPVRMALAAKPTGIPLLMQLMDVEFTQHGGSFEALGAIACIANSRFTAERYRSAYGVNPTVIYPFIALEDYKTETTRENVTFINPHPRKGCHIALEIARRCPEIPFTFVKGWPLTPEEDQQLAENLATLPNVTLIQAQKDMRSLYATCKILLVPSIWEETYGRVATEAQASGIPVIASTRGGLPESVGTGGILIDPESPIDTWVNAIKNLWNDDAHYAALSAAARAYASRREMDYTYQCDIMEQALLAAAKGGQAA